MFNTQHSSGGKLWLLVVEGPETFVFSPEADPSPAGVYFVVSQNPAVYSLWEEIGVYEYASPLLVNALVHPDLREPARVPSGSCSMHTPGTKLPGTMERAPPGGGLSGDIDVWGGWKAFREEIGVYE